MTGFVVTVDFVVRPEHAPRFSDLLRENAKASLDLEPGCQVFDVCIPSDDPARFFLYEVYDDAAAFADHLATEHFRRFDAATRDWLVSKSIRQFERQAL